MVVENGRQRFDFEHFGGLGPDVAKLGFRSMIFSILAAWDQILPEWPQKSNFKHLGNVGPDIARMDFF